MIAIRLTTDASADAGHQVLHLPNTAEGAALAQLLTGGIVLLADASEIHVPHTAEVDERIVALIDALAHVRYSAPALVQLTFTEATE